MPAERAQLTAEQPKQAARDESLDESGRSLLAAHARELGFARVGIAQANRSPNADRYLDWLAQGHHGTMDYMTRHVARRIDPRETVPGARSVVVATLPYEDSVPFPETPQGQPAEAGKIARYARGRDYHKVMPPLLRQLAHHIADEGRWQTWYSVDTGPILERDWAQQAGVGWIGKNGLIIDPELGSFCFLGVLVTDRPYPPDRPQTDHCGTCRACLDACPTDAFPAPRTVDARRCISYWTIEYRGGFTSETPELDNWLFGCDICQEVCPFNLRQGRPAPQVHPDFTPRPLPTGFAELSALDRESFLKHFAGTPITRTGVEGLRRNVAWARVSGSSSEPDPGAPPSPAATDPDSPTR